MFSHFSVVKMGEIKDVEVHYVKKFLGFEVALSEGKEEIVYVIIRFESDFMEGFEDFLAYYFSNPCMKAEEVEFELNLPYDFDILDAEVLGKTVRMLHPFVPRVIWKFGDEDWKCAPVGVVFPGVDGKIHVVVEKK